MGTLLACCCVLDYRTYNEVHTHAHTHCMTTPKGDRTVCVGMRVRLIYRANTGFLPNSGYEFDQIRCGMKCLFYTALTCPAGLVV